MSSLNSLYIKVETLEKIVETLKKKNEKGVDITVSIGDEPNDYNQNVSAYVSQTEEQRKDKKPRFYIGNGKTFWTDGKIVAVTKEPKRETPAQSQPEDDGLPF